MNIEMIDPEPSTALTVTARAALALGSDRARTDLAALIAKSAAINEIKNAIGRDQCHSAAMALVRTRTNIAKTGKAARDDATKFSKAVIAEENSLLAITAPEEARLLALRDTWDDAQAKEKAEAERKERALRLYRKLPGGRAVQASAEEVGTALSSLRGRTLDSIAIQPAGPGAFTIALTADGIQLSVRLDRQGARLHSVEA